MRRLTSPLAKAFALGRPRGGGGLLYGLLLLVSGWVLLIPLSPAVARITMLRMHLRAANFSLWAVQQIVPSMYNFANQGIHSGESLPAEELANLDASDGHYFNHFPVRNLTWVMRHQFRPAGSYGYYQSTYQGITLRSKYHLIPVEEGGWDVVWEYSDFKP